MSGPVWRLERSQTAACDVCLRRTAEVFVEGEVSGASLRPGRRLCPECYRHDYALLMRGEVGDHTASPAYARYG